MRIAEALGRTLDEVSSMSTSEMLAWIGHGKHGIGTERLELLVGTLCVMVFNVAKAKGERNRTLRDFAPWLYDGRGDDGGFEDSEAAAKALAAAFAERSG